MLNAYIQYSKYIASDDQIKAVKPLSAQIKTCRFQFEPNGKCQHFAKGCLHLNADIGAAVQAEGWLASGVNAKQTRGRLIVGLDDPPAGLDDDGGVGVVGLAMEGDSLVGI